MQPLISVGCSVHYWVSCAINKGGFFEIAFVSTHICLALRRLLTFSPHFDALTHVVIRVSRAFIFETFAEVCYSVFVQVLQFTTEHGLLDSTVFFLGRGGVASHAGVFRGARFSSLPTNACSTSWEGMKNELP